MEGEIMSVLRIESTVGIDEVGAQVLDRSGLSRIDYVDHFVLAPVETAGATPEQWARAMFGDVPDLAERFIWRGLLRLRLRPGRSPAAVAGWLISEQHEDWIRLEASSMAMRANLVVRAADGELSLTTMMQYDHPRARRVWAPLSAVHRRLTPGLLRDGAKKISAGRPALG